MKRQDVLVTSAIILFAGLSAALGWWLAMRTMWPAEQAPPPGVVAVAVGDTLPSLRFARLDDAQAFRLDGPGRVRLVNYWASWCGPCRKEMPVLDDYARQQGPHGVQVIGIALEDAAPARAFAREVPVGFTLLVETPGPGDSSVRLGNRRGILPFTVLVDARGRLAKTHYGAFADAAEVEAWVAR